MSPRTSHPLPPPSPKASSAAAGGGGGGSASAMVMGKVGPPGTQNRRCQSLDLTSINLHNSRTEGSDLSELGGARVRPSPLTSANISKARPSRTISSPPSTHYNNNTSSGYGYPKRSLFLSTSSRPPTLSEHGRNTSTATSATATATGSTTFEATLANVTIPQILFDGVPVFKITSSGKVHRRIMILSENRFTLCIITPTATTTTTTTSSAAAAAGGLNATSAAVATIALPGTTPPPSPSAASASAASPTTTLSMTKSTTNLPSLLSLPLAQFMRSTTSSSSNSNTGLNKNVISPLSLHRGISNTTESSSFPTQQQVTTTTSFLSITSSSAAAAAAAAAAATTSTTTTTTNNKDRTIDIGSIDRIQRGQNTLKFELARKLLPSLPQLQQQQQAVNANYSSSPLLVSLSSSSGLGEGGGGASSSNGGSSPIHKSSSFGTTLPCIPSTFINASGGGGGGGTMEQQYHSSSMLNPNLSFSIIFRGERTLDLQLALPNATSTTLSYILNALDDIIQTYQNSKVHATNDVLLMRYIWLDGDLNPSNTHISKTELHAILHRINYRIKKSQLDKSYKKFVKVLGLSRVQYKLGLSFDQTVTFLHKLKRYTWQVKPINQIWEECFPNATAISAQRFLRKFLKEVQGDNDVTLHYVMNLFRELNALEMANVSSGSTATAAAYASTPHKYIDRHRFEVYLQSRINDAYNPAKEKLDPSQMNHPLCHYYINSSHNTYLTGNQLRSMSSVEMYMTALYRGCRCVEIDVWEGGRHEVIKHVAVPTSTTQATTTNSYSASPLIGGGKKVAAAIGSTSPKKSTGTINNTMMTTVIKEIYTPVVYHGRTMTTKIPFIDTIRAIKVFLNVHPQCYPIILSLENHCSYHYQCAMATILIEVLGDSLYVPRETELSGPLPSPEKLRGKVVIKGRRPILDEFGDGSDDDEDWDVNNEDGNGGGGDGGDDKYHDNRYLLSNVGLSFGGGGSGIGSSSFGGLLPTVTSSSSDMLHNDTDDNGGGGRTARRGHSKKISPQLARITLLHGTSFKNWNESIDNPTYHMHSFSESQVSRIHQRRQYNHCVIYNKHHLTRCYPAGNRVGSSNFSPVLAWSMGCQLVALNFQTPDPPLRLNDGFFRQNANSGYVLKSRQLLDSAFRGERENLSLTLTIRVMSGCCLPKPKGHKKGECIDPYVKVAIYDVDDERGIRNDGSAISGSGGGGGMATSSSKSAEVYSEKTTTIVKDNGYAPIWNTQDFKFNIENESVSMVLFTVLDSDPPGKKDDFIASAAIPVCCLRKGYRNVRLFDANNTRSGAFDFASLLIKVDMEVIV